MRCQCGTLGQILLRVRLQAAQAEKADAPMTKRIASWIFLAGALVLTAISLWLARHQLTVLTRWKTVEATMVRQEVLRNHDADGYIYFQTKGTFRYVADGKEWNSS